eukprot:Seg3441.6 transcript_id=Seg3441.6/GoldUCD/mRNA.D3Y31 product="hypothetical protein" protein_id=Seg3441.6/GoldUCD/D3Y31
MAVENSAAASEEFMEEIQKFDCLYNKYSKDFRDKNKKTNSWAKVAEKFSITPTEAEKRFKNIRTAYGRFLKKSKNVPSGSGRDAVPVPREFENLGWLATYIDHRPTSTNMKQPKQQDLSHDSEDDKLATINLNDIEGDDGDGSDVYQLDEMESGNLVPEDQQGSIQPNDAPTSEAGKQCKNPTPGRIKSKKVPRRASSSGSDSSSKPWSKASNSSMERAELDKALVQSANTIASYLSDSKKRKGNPYDETDDEATNFCLSLVPRLKRMPPMKKAQLRMQIEQLFFQAEFAEPMLNPRPNAFSFNPAMCTSQLQQDMRHGFTMQRPYQLHEGQEEVDMNNPTYQDL